MYKVLTVVCVVAFLALGTSVFSAVVQRSDTARQSKQVAAISHELASTRHDLSEFKAELNTKTNASVHLGRRRTAHHRI